MNFMTKHKAAKHASSDRQLNKTCGEILEDTNATEGNVEAGNLDGIVARIAERMVAATWTLRRMPDRERSFLNMRGSLWPDMLRERGDYPSESISNFEARRRLRISAKEIDQMQPTLDLLLLLPDQIDRQIVFWTAWHQDGEVQDRVAWMKIRKSLAAANDGKMLSRWTLKRRYLAALSWLASLVALQV